MQYWRFFPAQDPAWGRIPVWGFGTVQESHHPLLEVGEKLSGYFPMADTLTASITVIDQDPYRLGALAAGRVFARLADEEVGVEVSVLDVSLVERESCRVGAARG